MSRRSDATSTPMEALPRPSTASDPTEQSRRGSTRFFFREWFHTHWMDLIWGLFVGAIAMALYLAPPPFVRTFPITFDSSGNIVYPDLAYPSRGWLIPTWASCVVNLAFPTLVYCLAQIRIRSAWDASSAIIGTAWAILLATTFQLVIKTLVGGFRPAFLEICMPDIRLAKDPARNKTGLNGVGFHQIMYTTEVCTQPNFHHLKNAITSFPSGHSAAGWASFGFLFLWLNAKLKVWADYRPEFWKIYVTLLPILFAILNSCILTVDMAHHWYDILAGSVIGIIMAIAMYRNTYAAVWDWRFNHVRLQRREAFAFESEDVDHYSANTLTGKVGWGGELSREKDSTRRESDATAIESSLARTSLEQRYATRLRRGIKSVTDPILGYS